MLLGLAENLAKRRPYRRVAHTASSLMGRLFAEALDLNGSDRAILIWVGLHYVLAG